MSLENSEREKTRGELLDALFENFLTAQMQLQIALPLEVAKIHKQITGLAFEGSAEHCGRIPFSIFRAIGILRERRTVTMSELSEAMKTPLSTTTGIVDFLTRVGYARRLPDPEDRRVVRISLTEEGNHAQEVVYTHIKELMNNIMSRLTLDEIKALVNISAKLRTK